MAERFDLVVAGGGPAGAASAITAGRRGQRVLLLERGHYPRHKVCGEFISAEALGLLASLLKNTPAAALVEQAPRIRRTRLFFADDALSAPIQPEAAAIPRYDLDAALWQAAAAAGVECRSGCAVRDITRNRGFHLATDAGDIQAAALILAAGRWSNLLPAPVARDNNWIGVKAHFVSGQPFDGVDLYFSRDGYCGVQPIGDGRINVCAMLSAAAVRPRDLMASVLGLHGRLQAESAAWQQATETVTTAPLLFARAVPVRDGALCAGDAAGFIDPFLGDGISLALQSGVLAAEYAANPAAYARQYRRRFGPLFRQAARLRWLLRAPGGVRKLGLLLLRWPVLGRALVDTTRAS